MASGLVGPCTSRKNSMDEIDLSKFDPKVRAELEKIGLLSCGQILRIASPEFRKLGNFTEDEILRIKAIASNKICHKGFVTALDALKVYQKKWRNVTFMCEAIDKITGGGLPTRGITEIYGESGTGKTQLCLQLCLSVQYPEENGGLGRGAIYICTEEKFPSTRLSQMASFFQTTKSKLDKNHNFTDKVLVDHISDVETFKECIFKRLPHVMNTMKIGLIVIDSLAALFRSNYSTAEFNARAKDLRAIGAQLHHLTGTFNITVLCVNQVAEAVDTEETVPALGLVWANIVTMKLMTTKVDDNTRKFKVVSAPHLPSKQCLYKITDKGIEGV